MATQAGNPKVRASKTAVVIEGLECRTPDVIEFFGEAAAEDLDELVCRALAVGVTGLRAAGVTHHVQTIKHEFERMTLDFQRSLEDVESRLVERVHVTFDPDEAESVSARIGLSVKEAHDGAAGRIEAARLELEGIIRDSFNPDLATSAVARLVKLVSDTRADIERLFDPSYEDSYLARLVGTVEDYFGDDGSVAQIVASRVMAAQEALEAQIRDLRDLVSARHGALDERRKSTASGEDFEDEIEEFLQHLAKPHGDTVERVGTAAGEAGPSKKGDFVITLREGLRFVVEAKDYSNPITLRGDQGILKALDDSMTNRNASFGVCVMKDPSGFPREVGSFNDYDGDKILCLFGPDGGFLEVAYRWARASTLTSSAAEAGLDVAVIEAALNEVRASLRELKKIDAKASAIVKSAEAIRGLVTFQLRRAQNALDEAESSLTSDVSQETA